MQTARLTTITVILTALALASVSGIAEEKKKNGDLYRNQLPYRCPGLALHDTFMYRTSLNQLCHLDIITVMDSIGFGLSPGASCGLGHFYPITEEQAEKLREMAGN